MKRNLIKAILVMASMASLFIGKAAFAADCQPITDVKVDGVVTSDINPVVIAGHGKLTVRIHCDDDTIGGVTATDSVMQPGSSNPKATWKSSKSQKVMIKVESAFRDFEGVLSGKIDETRTVKLRDGSGATYSINIRFKDEPAGMAQIGTLQGEIDDKADKKDLDGKADKGDLALKADKKYVDDGNAEQDGRINSLATDGRVQLDAAPVIYWRPELPVAVGGEGRIGYRFGKSNETAFRLMLMVGGAHGYMATRPVNNVPYTGQSVDASYYWFGLAGLADIPLGSRVSLGLGGALVPTFRNSPQVSVGQVATGSTVWDIPSVNEFTLLAQGVIDFRVFLASNNHRGLFLGLGLNPGIELIGTKNLDGGDVTTNKFRFIGAFNFGANI